MSSGEFKPVFCPRKKDLPFSMFANYENGWCCLPADATRCRLNWASRHCQLKISIQREDSPMRVQSMLFSKAYLQTLSYLSNGFMFLELTFTKQFATCARTSWRKKGFSNSFQRSIIKSTTCVLSKKGWFFMFILRYSTAIGISPLCISMKYCTCGAQTYTNRDTKSKIPEMTRIRRLIT